MMTTTETMKKEWLDKWEELAKKDYHGKRDGYWRCYYNEKNEIVYEYISI